MGKMKQLGIQMIRYVYELKMIDDEVVKRFQEYPEEWIRSQLKYVREHPEECKRMHQ